MSSIGTGRSLRSSRNISKSTKSETRRSLPAKRRGRPKLSVGTMKENKRPNLNESVENVDKIILESMEVLEETPYETDGKRRQSLRSWSRSTMQSPLELLAANSSYTFSNIFLPVPHGRSPLPQLSWGDASEVWDAMLSKDYTYKRDPLYLRRHPSLQPRMRAILLDWIVEVCEVYRLHKETYHLVVDYVDRYLSCQNNIAKQRLQLVGITALFIASKLEEIYPPKLSEFAYVTDGACTEKEILMQEILILQSLDWKLSPVTPNSWLASYLQIANHLKEMPEVTTNIDTELFEFPNYTPLDLVRVSQLMDLCLLDTGCLQFSYSIIAASCMYHLIPADIATITGHQFDELYPCIQWLTPFARTVRELPPIQIKHFDKINPDEAHSIQVHHNGMDLLDDVQSKMSDFVPINIAQRMNTPIKCNGIITPPASTKKRFQEVLILK